MKANAFIHYIIISLVSLILASCVTEEEFSNTKQGNLEALWKTLDAHYCFFQYKQEQYGLDWTSVHTKYQKQLKTSMSTNQFFDLCGDMLRELKDGHVTLTSAFNTARYGDWFENYATNFSDSLERRYLGTNYRMTNGLKYRILSDSVGYIRCASFEYTFGNSSLCYMLAYLSKCKGLIIDIRNNGGGMLTSAQALAECFIDHKTTGGYIRHKTGTDHNSFSSPEAITLTPQAVCWKRPIIILTNRQCYSAANTFVMYMKGCTQAIVMGDKTGGGGGMPFTSELPNGWKIRFSAVPMYDVNMQLTEGGIDPDIKISLLQSDVLQNKDTMIETAIEKIKHSY